MNPVIDAILRRRSVRSYTAQQVLDEQRNLILEAAIHAPNGMNRQMWRFSAVTDEWLEVLRKTVRTFFLHLRVDSTMPPSFAMFQKLAAQDEGFSFFHGAPMLVLASSERGYANGAADCAAAIENMLLAATSLGLGSCWINTLSPICDEKPIRDVLTGLGIPEDHVICGGAAIGFAAGEPERKDRDTAVITVVGAAGSRLG